jgi:hypothetical protein
MVVKILIVVIAAAAIIFFAWRFADHNTDSYRLKRWERSERTRLFAKKKAKRVQEAVDVLYNEINEKENPP